MSINGPVFDPNSIYHVQPIDPDREDQRYEREKKKKVSYRDGRSWSEKDQEQLLESDIASSFALKSKGTKKTMDEAQQESIYFERAKRLLGNMTTLEEKVAQLLFLEMEAVYDRALQNETEVLIQEWQIGGVVFTGGDYRRQAFLIERYQELSKTFLLVANSLSHGLSLYFQKDGLPAFAKDADETLLSDLGKTIMVQNRALGVQVQLESDIKITMLEGQLKAFGKGIREVQGIVGKLSKDKKPDALSRIESRTNPYLAMHFESSFTDESVKDSMNRKTLYLMDLTQEEFPLEKLVEGFKKGYDAFILNTHITAAVNAICEAVISNKILEEHIERRVLKLLTLKSLYLS